MRRGTLILLLLILLLAAGAAFVDFWPHSDKGATWHGVNNPFVVQEGLDLQVGVSILLVPDPSQHYTKAEVDSAIGNTLTQIENRVNGGLGVKEPTFRLLSDSRGNQSISIDLPSLNGGNLQQQIQTLIKPGVLEFWDTGQSPLEEGAALDPSQYTANNPGGKPLFTGKDLDPNQISVGQDPQTSQIVINFEMKGGAISRFADFTTKHIGDYLTVTLDRKVISSAVIQSAINGPGIIQGSFTQTQAQRIVTVLQYGALPLSMTVASAQTVGATLGQDSITKSEIAGIIGLGIVILFMLLYYRLPGLLADCALILYSIFTFAIFKLIGVTLTLAGIAGFVLSIGMAVDANVLIFERMKEELRAGRLLASAITIGWERAWLSIRDSNICTLLTCAVLYAFGSTAGVTIIVGFATTLLIGVLVS